MQSMDIYSLYWIEQHLKECKRSSDDPSFIVLTETKFSHNNDYKSKKEYVKYVKTSVRMF